jgi:ribokinase
MKVAVVGHLEYVDFVEVDRLPAAGEIVHAEPRLAVAAGGGAVAAVALARWAKSALFFTSFGDDDYGRRARTELAAYGVTLHAVTRTGTPQRRAITFVDAQRERTIVVIGTRHVAHGADPLPWSELATCDAVYITGGDAGAVRAARAARVVVATSRCLALLRSANIVIDALVGSANDPGERYAPGDLDPAPRIVVRTAGSKGVRFVVDGVEHHHAATPVKVTGDTYGAGDTFAAGLTYALGEGRPPADAVAFAAQRAAEVLAFRGPYPPRS